MEKDKKSEIHITNNFNAPIGQHIDHVDTINFRMDGEGKFEFGIVENVDKGTEPSNEMPNGDATEVAIKACFKVCNEFVKGQIDKVIKEFYNGSAANLALIEIVLYDHNLLYKRNTHKAFINALAAWNLINVSDEKELNRIVRAVSDKFKRMPEEGYKSWSNDFVNDKSFCENIGKKLGDTMKYNR